MYTPFLKDEYQHCFEQLRFYDTRNAELLKYLSSLSAAAATAQFAIFKFLNTISTDFYIWQSLLSFLVYVASVLLVLAMTQNRLYFIFVARQLNAIRRHGLSTDAIDFKDNQLWLDTDFPAVKPHSVHTYQIIGSILISSVFAGSSVFGLLAALSSPLWLCWIFAAIFFFLSAVKQHNWVFNYLTKKGQANADTAVHRPDQ